MLAAVYCGNGKIELQERNVPEIIESRDAIVRVTLSTICSSDLHIRNGAVPRAIPGTILGHEFVGEIEQVGPGVKTFKKGDRVAANCITFCGECYFCRKGFINNCEHGGWELGCRIDGCQAEYVRVPYADMGLTKIPDGVTDKNALFLGDILSSGYFGAELSEIHPGDIVAILGAGPVGLCTALCANLFGAARVVLIDPDESRLTVAKKLKLADYTISRVESAEIQIRELTQGRGADAVVEAAGGKNSFQIAWKIARPNAAIAVVAMYEEDQVLSLPKMYGKNLRFKTGGVDAVNCSRLMDLIASGKINTDFLITHEFPLNQIMEGYRVFEAKQDGCLKVAITGKE